MKRAIVFFADGMEECEALITVDLLRRSGIETVTASIMGRKKIVSAHHIAVEADVLAEEANFASADVLILPGGGMGTENLKGSDLVAQRLLEFSATGRYIAAICAAPTVLGKTGLLRGRRATVFPGCEGDCIGAEMTGEKVTVDGNIITGQAVGATFEFALTIIEKLLGASVAEKIQNQVHY